MEYLDLCGMTCPAPVVETKRVLESKDAQELEIILDDAAAFENVKRFLGSRGFEVKGEQEGTRYRIHGTAGKAEDSTLINTEKVLVYIDGETMGRGNDELGGVLMRSFLNTLKELEVLPWKIVFLNGGVKLVSEDSPYLSIIKDLEGRGIEMLSCGTCLDYFHLKEKIGAGRITNMFEILSSCAEANRVIRP